VSEPGKASFDRLAVVVDDLDAAVADLTDIFGQQLTRIDVDVLGVRLALGDEGLELVQEIPGGTPPPWKFNWAGGRIASLALNVPDLDEARRRLEERGVKLVSEIETPGGMMEYYYEAAGFHGIPITLCSHTGEGFAATIGAEEGVAFTPKLS